jgi:hypothetical protein
MPLIDDVASRGLQKLRQQVEACRLPRAIRTDERMDCAGLDPQIDAVDR